MYTILKRSVDFRGLVVTKSDTWIVTKYWLFKVNLRDWKPSSLENEDPIEWWFDSEEELRNELGEYDIEDEVKDYFLVTNIIHRVWKNVMDSTR